MATPYSEEVIERAKRYYQTKFGIAVMATESLGATNSYAIGKMDAGVAQAAFTRIDRRDIDALVVPGGNFPTMDRIELWEQQFGKPVITGSRVPTGEIAGRFYAGDSYETLVDEYGRSPEEIQEAIRYEWWRAGVAA